MTYYLSPPISDYQKQIIIGTVLGGSSIVKPKKGRNCYLFMRSSNKEWLIYKTNELGNIASQRPFTEDGSTLRWHSNCYPVFNEFHDILYKNNKKLIKMDVLDRLRDIGLAVWYGDCGRLTKDKVLINTHKFGEEGSEIIKRYFKEVEIGKSDVIKERGNYRVRLDKESSERFLMIIANHLPDFMHSKLLLPILGSI